MLKRTVSSFLQTGSFIQIQISQLLGRVEAERHLVVVVDLPPLVLVPDVTHVVAGVTGGPHVGDEGREGVAATLITSTKIY